MVKNKSGKYRTEGYNDGSGPHTIILNLHIINIQKEDYGVYSCYASNNYGTDREDMVLYGKKGVFKFAFYFCRK